MCEPTALVRGDVRARGNRGGQKGQQEPHLYLTNAQSGGSVPPLQPMTPTSALAAIFSFALIGCGSVSDSDPAFWAPSQDLGGGSLVPGSGGSAGFAPSFGGDGGFGNEGNGGFGNEGNGGVPGNGGGGSTGLGGGSNSGACTMHFEFTTLTYHGKYSPKNIGAVWITTPRVNS